MKSTAQQPLISHQTRQFSRQSAVSSRKTVLMFGRRVQLQGLDDR